MFVEEPKTTVWKIISGIIPRGSKQDRHRQYDSQHDTQRSITSHGAIKKNVAN